MVHVRSQLHLQNHRADPTGARRADRGSGEVRYKLKRNVLSDLDPSIHESTD